jgi:hypothetical protein
MFDPTRSNTVPLSDSAGGTDQLMSLAAEAHAFLAGFSWSGQILEQRVGPIIEGILGTFLFRLEPSQESVDEWLWVIVGDLPPAYIVTDDAPDGPSALRRYIEEMCDWVRAVEKDAPVDDLIPVNVPPTKQYAEQLRSRLDFLRSRIIPAVSTGSAP